MAIGCDGATYQSSKNARDRDSLRQRVLENMGWRFYRVWSTDWYRNKPVEKERLLRSASEAVANRNCGKENKRIDLQESAKISDEVKDRFVTEIAESHYAFPEYKQTDALSIIYNNGYNFCSAVLKILNVEAPLSEEFLLKRIVSYFGREKVTSFVLDEFNQRMLGCYSFGIIRKEGFLYLKGMDAPKLRVPGDRREIKYIAIEELADGLYTLIKQNVTANREGLYKVLTNLLGFSRTGDAIYSRYDEAIRYLKRAKLIVDNKGILSTNSQT